MGNIAGLEPRKMEKWEMSILEEMFRDLAKRSPGKTMDKATFLQLFKLPGIMGERLFKVFDRKQNDVIDWEEFIEGMRIYSYGSIDEKLLMLFKMYDLAGDSVVHPEELMLMLNSLLIPAQFVFEGKEPSPEQVAETHAVVKSIVRRAYVGKSVLSFDDFKDWLKSTPEVMRVLEETFVRRSWEGLFYDSAVDESSVTDLDFSGIECKSCGFRSKFCHLCRGKLDGGKCVTCGEILLKPTEARYCISCGEEAGFVNSIAVEDAREIDATTPRRQVAIEIIHAGTLYKKSGALKRSWVPRYFILTQHFLYSYQSASDPHPSSVMFIEGCFIEIVKDSDSIGYYGIRIAKSADATDKIVLYATSEDERMQWVSELRKSAKTDSVSDFYEVGKEIGRGKFSTVYEATEIRTQQKWAIKVCDKAKIPETDKAALRNEIAILSVIHHPNVVQMKEVFESKDSFHIVMKMYPYGDLLRTLRSSKSRFPEITIKKIIWNITKAVSYLHSFGVVHRDIKPDNILRTDPDDLSKVALSDFGLGKFAAPQEVMKLACGTLSYVAPEVLTLSGYSYSVDYWSIGVILYLLFGGELPFQGKTQREIINRTLKCEIDFSGAAWVDVTDEAKDLILGLLKKNPKERLTGTQVLKHKWFDDIRLDMEAGDGGHLGYDIATGSFVLRVKEGTEGVGIEDMFQEEKDDSKKDTARPAALRTVSGEPDREDSGGPFGMQRPGSAPAEGIKFIRRGSGSADIFGVGAPKLGSSPSEGAFFKPKPYSEITAKKASSTRG